MFAHTKFFYVLISDIYFIYENMIDLVYSGFYCCFMVVIRYQKKFERCAAFMLYIVRGQN